MVFSATWSIFAWSRSSNTKFFRIYGQFYGESKPKNWWNQCPYLTVWHPSCGNLNFSRTVAVITKWFWVTIKGYLSYLLPKFEDLVPTSLDFGAIWKVFAFMEFSVIWNILAGPNMFLISGIGCIWICSQFPIGMCIYFFLQSKAVWHTRTSKD